MNVHVRPYNPAAPSEDATLYGVFFEAARVGEVDGELAGFMATTPHGYIDLAFVRPSWMGRGVAQALYGIILEPARTNGLTRLTTDASHLARPFLCAPRLAGRLS